MFGLKSNHWPTVLHLMPIHLYEVLDLGQSAKLVGSYKAIISFFVPTWHQLILSANATQSDQNCVWVFLVCIA